MLPETEKKTFFRRRKDTQKKWATQKKRRKKRSLPQKGRKCAPAFLYSLFLVFSICFSVFFFRFLLFPAVSSCFRLFSAVFSCFLFIHLWTSYEYNPSFYIRTARHHPLATRVDNNWTFRFSQKYRTDRKGLGFVLLEPIGLKSKPSNPQYSPAPKYIRDLSPVLTS